MVLEINDAEVSYNHNDDTWGVSYNGRVTSSYPSLVDALVAAVVTTQGLDHEEEYELWTQLDDEVSEYGER